MPVKKKDSLVKTSIVCALLCFVLGLSYGRYEAYEKQLLRKQTEAVIARADAAIEHVNEVLKESKSTDAELKSMLKRFEAQAEDIKRKVKEAKSPGMVHHKNEDPRTNTF